MLKKLLFICLTIFAFAQANAQLPSTVTGEYTNCGPNSVDFNPLFDDAPTNSIATLENGKYTYRRDIAFGDDSVGIVYDGAKWVMYYTSDPTNIIFEQTTHNPADNLIDETHLFPPDTGWLPDASPCATGSMLVTSGAVLKVDKNDLTNMTLYPNPATNFVNITGLEKATNVQVTNIAGQVVKNNILSRNDNRIDIQDLSKGFYFVEIEGLKTIKLIKQ